VLDKLNALVGLSLDLEELQGASRALEARVDEALAGNEELQGYVRRLDAGIADDEPPDELAATVDEEPPGEIPSSDIVLRELEEFLRRSQQEARRESGQDEDDEDDGG
jgi:hypothetical protein